jgi:hypothetical protein
MVKLFLGYESDVLEGQVADSLLHLPFKQRYDGQPILLA